MTAMQEVGTFVPLRDDRTPWMTFEMALDNVLASLQVTCFRLGVRPYGKPKVTVARQVFRLDGDPIHSVLRAVVAVTP